MKSRWIWAVLAGILFVSLSYGTVRSDSGWLLLQYFLLFSGYAWVCLRSGSSGELRFWLWAGGLYRLMAVFAFPNLSDDIYRFIWDGRLVRWGFNPFTLTPTQFFQQHPNTPGLNEGLLHLLNSPDYYTIYPPVCQSVFALGAWIAPDQVYFHALVIKLFLWFCELGTLYLLPRLLRTYGLPVWQAAWYALNPLIVLEICGNAHFEGAMIFFLCLSLYSLELGKKRISSLAWSFSIASKLLPMLFWPLWMKRMGWKAGAYFTLLAGISLAFLFYPLINGVFLNHFGDSLHLYFQKFEFNASLYYLFRELGYGLTGYNLIKWLGPVLSFLSGLSVLWLAIRKSGREGIVFVKYALFSISLYLACSTTVHPWYVCLPVFLCTLTHYRYPILWSGLAYLTYLTYATLPYEEHLWWIVLEYVPVYFLFWWEAKGIDFKQ